MTDTNAHDKSGGSVRSTSGAATQPPAAQDTAHTRAWLPLIAAWLVVLVPSAWGVGQVVLKSMALFR